MTKKGIMTEKGALTAPWVKATSARPRDHAPAALKPYQEGIIAGICGAAAITVWFLGEDMMFAEPVLHALAWQSVLVGNLFAAVAMGGYLWRRHPHMVIYP